MSIINFNYLVNYTQWTLVAQHPNLNNVTQVFSFAYKPLVPYKSMSKSHRRKFCCCSLHFLWENNLQQYHLTVISSTDDTGMFYGLKFFNDVIMEAGPDGNVQSEMILQKDAYTFTLSEGWAFPRKIYFNGEECMMPSPDQYPHLLNSAPANLFPTSSRAALLAICLLVFWWCPDNFNESLVLGFQHVWFREFKWMKIRTNMMDSYYLLGTCMKLIWLLFEV